MNELFLIEMAHAVIGLTLAHIVWEIFLKDYFSIPVDERTGYNTFSGGIKRLIALILLFGVTRYLGY